MNSCPFLCLLWPAKTLEFLRMTPMSTFDKSYLSTNTGLTEPEADRILGTGEIESH